MAKRRTRSSEDYYIDSTDDPIGLTSAFRPTKGPQSVDYAPNDDPVGLTQAFGAVSAEEDTRTWSEENKWDGFDWDAGYTGAHAAVPEKAAEEKPAEGEAQGVAEVAEQAADESAPAAVATGTAAVPTASTGGSGRGRHAAPEKELSPRMKRSRRTRKVLIALVVLLIILLGVVGFFAFRTFSQSQEEVRQAQGQGAVTREDVIENISADAAGQTSSSQTDVPDLSGLFGKTTDEAIALIGHGAYVTSNREDTDKSTAIKTNLNVALNDEPADSKTGTPTVYLGLDKDGKVIEVGYSASAAALGFGSLSFTDAVNKEHVVEKTFGRIGFNVPEGSVTLPEDKSKYSTYAKDGTTVERERCTFESGIDVNGMPCTWSAVLSYDYKTQIHTGNLDDTIRIIYVYVSQNIEPEPEPEPEPAPSAEAAPAE